MSRGPYNPWWRSKKDHSLRCVRIAAGLTQAEAADLLSLSRRTYINRETGVSGSHLEQADASRLREILAKCATAR